MVFVLCFGLEAYSQSSQQARVKVDNMGAPSLEKGGGAGNMGSGRKVRHKHSKVHHAYVFKVLYKNGVEKEVTGRIRYSKEDSTFSLASKDEIIKASDTQYIYRVDKISGDTLVGNTYGNSWLFPVISGKINGYSTYAEKSAGYLTHISQGSNSQFHSFDVHRKHVREQTVEMLTEMIRGNEAAEQLMREHLRKARRKELAKNIALGGLGFSVLGIAAAPLATALVVGLPVGVGAGVATVSIDTVDLLEVIATYNSAPVLAFF